MIDTRKWSLLTSSVIIYGMAWFATSWFWWTVFIFLIPVYYTANTRTLSFKEGLYYGVLLWGLLVSGVYYSIFVMAKGPLIVRLIPIIVIILYQAFFSGVWFWATEKAIRLLRLTAAPQKLALWVATTALFFYWAVRWSLSPFNNFEGYFFMHPLLPLAEHPIFLSLMPTLGSWVVMGLLLVTNALCTLLFLGYTFWFACASTIPWVISILTGLAASPASTPAWVERIGHIPTIFISRFELGSFAEMIQTRIKDVLDRYPETELIVFPESSFDRTNLSSSREIAQLWGEKYVGKPVNLVIGAFNWEGKNYHNAAYWIQNGKMSHIFNKRHAMLLTEGVAPWYDIPLFRSLYYDYSPPIVPSSNPRTALPLLGGKQFVPYICSELFFNDKPDDNYPQSIILALCNDNWSRVQYVRHMMYLAARFKAIAWQREIVYVSYHYNGYIDKRGYATPLHNPNTF